MHLVDSVPSVSLSQPINPLGLAFEKTELESFCNVVSLRREEALSALCGLRIFLNTQENLSFEKMKGGDCNAPILVSLITGFHKTPIYVLKREPDISWAEKRMKALDEMRGDGFEHLPCIIKDAKHNYLVKLGDSCFSCIEYLEPDSDQSSSIEQMFMLASNFHAFSKRNSLTEELRARAIDNYTNENIAHLPPELIKWNPSIFETESWLNCVKSAHYFTTEPFREIYNRLPTQIIHGDITPNNTIISKGKPFFIDLDSMRTDVRLLDFAIFLGWSFLDRYLSLVEENKLSSCVRLCYGQLETIEEEYFPTIVLFGRCCTLKWSLRELRQALYDKDPQKEQRFGDILKGTIREINEICKRVPQIREIIKSL